MKNLLKFTVLTVICFTAILLRLSTAQAAAIAGKIGVGTWNTQAEFADVKVVKGTTTLYQSNFSSGMTEWTTSGGTWATQNGYIRQTRGGAPAIATVGSTDWSDYTLTLKARKISGDEGFLISFGIPGTDTASRWNIGGFGNTKHLLEVPGVPTSDVAGSIQTGVWYDIKVELSGIDICCYLNGTLVHDTARFLDMSDRTDRFNQLINSPGFGLLSGIEQGGLTNLRDRTVYIGEAAKATFAAMPMSGLTFAALTPKQQAFIIRKVNRNRMTWVQGYGYGSDGWRDWTITTNMDAAVKLHNSLSVFDKHLTANNDPGVATADANYDGWMRFGTQLTLRTCVHEIAHALGSGTYWRWEQMFNNGIWTGVYANRQMAEFDGAGAVMHQSGVHFYPYGMNYESEYSDENARRAVLLIAAVRRDMGLGDQVNWAFSSDVPNGSYAVLPRHAAGKVLDVTGTTGENGSLVDITTPNGSNNQKFLFEYQADGTYRINSAMPGNRVVELPYGNTDNGNRVQLYDNNDSSAQRWFLIPTDSGYFKIAPLNNIFKAMEVSGVSNADGAPVQNWEYLDNFGQQWKIVPNAQISSVTDVPNGTYTLTPRHAQDKLLEIYGTTGESGSAVDIWTANGGDNQKFLLDLQTDGTYRIRTALAGNRPVELPGGNTDNGNALKLADDNSATSQRWYLIPTGDGWYKIAPKSDLTKSLDVAGISTADGAIVQNWDYLSGYNQQWKLTPTNSIVQLTASTFSVGEEAGTASITVTRTGNLSNPVSVAYATANGTATAPADYTATSGTLSFAANETSKTINVPIINDTLAEASETLTLTLSNPLGGAVLGETTSSTLTIVDNDTVTAINIGALNIAEGNSDTKIGSFPVTLSAASSKTVSVNYATSDGTATAGSDYTAASGTLTFTAGETAKTIDVTIIGDTVIEANEAFNLTLSNNVNATLPRKTTVGTITNDDIPGLVINDVTIVEGNSGSKNAVLTVTASRISPFTMTVKYATTNGTATAGSDYTATTGTLTFAPGEASKTVSVEVLGDTVVEANETFNVGLNSATNASITDSIGVGTITTDDFPAASINDVTLTEGNSGSTNANFTVSLSAPAPQAITVNYVTANGTATSGKDYNAVTNKVTFAVGQSTKTLSVPVTGDLLDEEDETFQVNLSAPVNCTLADAQGIGTITDDDAAPSISINDVSVTESSGAAVNATFTVKLAAASGRPITVDYSTNSGTALTGSDFTAKSGTLTFTPGVTSQTVAISIVGDLLDEPNETFTVELSNAVNSTIGDAQGVGTIVDNDSNPVLKIAGVTVAEGNSGSANANLLVTLSAASGQSVTVNYATADVTATAGSDYTAANGTLTFAPGETSKNVVVAVIGDTAIESDETFKVTLSTPVNATIQTATATSTITNDDLPAISISDISKVEGNTGSSNATFTVTLSASSPLTVEVNYATANGTATAGSDYTAVSGKLSFAAGQTSKMVNVLVTGDTAIEASETFTFNLSTPVRATLAKTSATATIVNDDLPTASIADVAVTEGNSGTTTNAIFTVNLSTASPLVATLNYTTSDNAAIAGKDYTKTTGQLTFNAGETSKTITVPILGDNLDESNETFNVDFSAPINVNLPKKQSEK